METLKQLIYTSLTNDQLEDISQQLQYLLDDVNSTKLKNILKQLDGIPHDKNEEFKTFIDKSNIKSIDDNMMLEYNNINYSITINNHLCRFNVGKISLEFKHASKIICYVSSCCKNNFSKYLKMLDNTLKLDFKYLTNVDIVEILFNNYGETIYILDLLNNVNQKKYTYIYLGTNYDSCYECNL